MARRRTRSRLDLGAPRGRPFFRPSVVGGSSVGRAPWRARLTGDLLRPVPPGFIGQESIRATARVLGDLRARRARIAPTWPVGPLRQAVPVRRVRSWLPLGKPVLSRRSTPCDRRRERKEVMFASGVAGRGWKRGGPRMRDAVFTVDSQYSCR